MIIKVFLDKFLLTTTWSEQCSSIVCSTCSSLINWNILDIKMRLIEVHIAVCWAHGQFNPLPFACARFHKEINGSNMNWNRNYSVCCLSLRRLQSRRPVNSQANSSWLISHLNYQNIKQFWILGYKLRNVSHSIRATHKYSKLPKF